MLRRFASVVMAVAALAFTTGSGVVGDQSDATTKAAFRPLEECVIAITDPVPADDGMRGSLNPPLSAAIRHAGGKPMTITFSTDASGQWQDIGVFKQSSSGTYRASPKDMLRRGRTYCWKVTATDGQVTATKVFTFNLAYVVGPSHTIIQTSDCWKYGYIKHGWEKGRFFATTQRGMWAAYDLDKGWYRTHQLIAKNRERAGMTGSFPVHVDDGGVFGHPYWGYWDGSYHVMHGLLSEMSSRTFDGFNKFVYPDDLKPLKLNPQRKDWPEGITYTFSEDRAWIMAIDFDPTQPPRAEDKNWVRNQGRGIVKYWQWTKAGGWEKPVVVGTVANHTGRAALVRQSRDTWYLFVCEGKANDGLPGALDLSCSSTLKYFKSTDAGKTWGTLQDTGVPAHAYWSSVSFARYGDNYYVFVSANGNSQIHFTRDLEKFPKGEHASRTVAVGMGTKPHGTLLHQGALIFTVASCIDYVDEQVGIVVPVPEMMSHPETPSEPLPANGAALSAGTTETELSVKVHGKQTYDVAFYWADGTLIGEDELLREGDKARITVKGLTAGKTYQWYAVARGALLEYYGNEPDTTSDEKWTETFRYSIK